jgi:hypothetical protein
MDLGGVLVVVLITEPLGGVDEGNKMNPLWELMKEIGRYIMGVNEGNR